MVYLGAGRPRPRPADGGGRDREVRSHRARVELRQLLRSLLGPAAGAAGAAGPPDPERVRRPRHLGDRAGAGARSSAAMAPGPGSTRIRPGWPSRSASATRPDDAQSHIFLGLALAYLGRKAEAIAEGEKGVALLPIAKDGYTRRPTCSTSSSASTSWSGSLRRRSTGWSRCSRCRTISRPAGSGSIRTSIRSGAIPGSANWWRARRDGRPPRPARGRARRPLRPRARARPRRDGDGLPGARPQARPPGRAQGAPPRARRLARPRPVPARDPDGRPAAASPHPDRARLRGGRGPALVHHAVRRGREPPRPAPARAPASGGGRAPDSPRGGAGAPVCPRPRDRPPRHQAGELLLTGDGNTLVADFGIARVLGGRPTTSSPRPGSRSARRRT